MDELRDPSPQTLRLLAEILERPGEDHYGLDLARRAELKSGTLYPALRRLERLGVLTSDWESVDPRKEGRPRRRMYRLTGEGELVARRAVEDQIRALGGSVRGRRTGETAPPAGRRMRPQGGLA